MCGIAGQLNFERENSVHLPSLNRMLASVAHRGPDDEGLFVDGNIGLGHRRLSIIDLSPLGHQPMRNADGTIWITFNGEVYNFPDLREELEIKGHKFRSRSDTEVVLRMYEEYGEAFVERLDGMFAFGIWDARKRRLILVRDRLGVKPLYYHCDSQGIMFGSEIKAILHSGRVIPEADYQALHSFLTLQFVPSPQTAFRTIRKLPPASVLICDQDGQIRVHQYWKLELQEPFTNSEATLTEQLREMMQRATRARMISDVPVGVLLSGGVDSSCIVAAMRKESNAAIRSFSIAFSNAAYDESRYATLAARRFGTEHHSYLFGADDLRSALSVMARFDEPFGDQSAIPTYVVCSHTAQEVKVALSGDGGDESFCGYDRYLALYCLDRLRKVPGHRLLPQLIRLLPNSTTERSLLRYVRGTLGLAGQTAESQYASAMLGLFHESDWRSLYAPDFRNVLNGPSPVSRLLCGWKTSGRQSVLEKAMQADLAVYIPECLNVKVDIASMAHGLEVRSPFLDHRLIEFASRVPVSMRFRLLNRKRILKRAFATELPPEILRRPKAGFNLPLGSWFRGELKTLIEDTLLGQSFRQRGLFDHQKVELMLKGHLNGTANYHVQLWRLMILEHWLQAWFDSRASIAC